MNLLKKKQKSTKKGIGKWLSKVWTVVLAGAALVTSLLVPSKKPIFAYYSLPYRNTHINYVLQVDVEKFGANAGYPCPVIYCPDGVTPAYCLQADVAWVYESSIYTTGSYDSLPGLTPAQKQRIKALSYFGYMYNGRTDDMWYYATQFAIWKYLTPEHINRGYKFGDVGNNYGQYNAQIESMMAQIVSDADKFYSDALFTPSPKWKVTDLETGLVIKYPDQDPDELSVNVGTSYLFEDTSKIVDGCDLAQNDYGSRFVKTGSNQYTLTPDETDGNVQRIIAFKPKPISINYAGSEEAYVSTNYSQNFSSRSTPSSVVIRALEEAGDMKMPPMKTVVPSVQIKKQDANGNGIAGAKMALYHVSTTGTSLVKEWISDGNYCEKIPVSVGKYRIVEVEAPEGYYLSDPMDITVKKPVGSGASARNIVQKFEMSDDPIAVKVAKVDASDGTPISGAKLQLTDGGFTVYEEWVSDGTDHVLDTSKLKAGSTYAIKEIESPDGYFLPTNTVTFQVPSKKDASILDADGFIKVNFENVGIDYRVEKVDSITGMPVSGAKMQLIGSNNTVLEEWVTDGTPHKLDKSKLEIDRYYAIREVEAPDGYYLMPEDITFSIDPFFAGSSYTITARDYPVTYKIGKTDEKGQMLAGATLALYDSSDNLVDQWVSTNGYHTVTALNQNETYYVRELAAPAGYYRSTKEVKFTVERGNLESQQEAGIVNFSDSPISFYFDKIDETTKARLAGVKFMLQTEAGADLVEMTSSSAGPVEIPSQYLEAGKTYRIHETAALDGYYYASEDTLFTVPATAEEAKSQKSSYFTKTIKDKKIKFAVYKVDEETNANVAGATLGLYADEAGTNLLYSWTTKEEPEVVSDAITLIAGTTYYVREIYNPTGYFLNEGAVEVQVPYAVTTNETVKATFKNVPIHWNIKKVDENGDLLTTTVNKSSCILEVYDTHETLTETGDDTLVATLDTADKTYEANEYFDMQSYIDQGLIIGGHHYRIHEKRSPLGYKIADDQIIAISCSGTTQTVLSSVVNEPIEVHFRKVDEKGNTLTYYNTLTNGAKAFKIGIYDEDLLRAGDPDALVLTIDTTSQEYRDKGYASIGMYLSVQKTYVAKELEQPFGYYKAKDYVFQVDTLPKTGNVSELVMVDPTVKVQFRKEDSIGNVLTDVGGEGFEFQVIDNATNEVVGTINTKDGVGKSGGWIQIGHWMQEGRTYRIHETYAPGNYSYSTRDVMVTVPGYYVESAGNVINIKL